MADARPHRKPNARLQPKPDARLQPKPLAPSQLKLIAPSASPEEAAAVVAALERFLRATARSPAPAGEVLDRWRHAALLEGISRAPDGEPQPDLPDPWDKYLKAARL